jgi:hypothetical protein
MLPSLFASNGTHDWNVLRAAVYGAGIGLAAVLLKMLGPHSETPHVLEIAAAVVGFAALCAAAAVVRNLVARHLIRPD